ncbi:uncharacterized protein L969DRAFT_118270 [Mixia osmundae IAM 14324]|uniref:uncharacterized protein n=1 Tax=Mixia osmundae (strain CBS 9802 / IAM 14324 / JCM 22182 / KY 12970) TaxID=764103 RepID=UPI0004A5533B|nr:uncharacterized protein L969DRAFT_118270 [Mixia osmundae IAM 14324]KEI41914.1 hypothetical protein L969DRAFT_118270 [Mixia osmundae IAM 14324]
MGGLPSACAACTGAACGFPGATESAWALLAPPKADAPKAGAVKGFAGVAKAVGVDCPPNAGTEKADEACCEPANPPKPAAGVVVLPNACAGVTGAMPKAGAAPIADAADAFWGANADATGRGVENAPNALPAVGAGMLPNALWPNAGAGLADPKALWPNAGAAADGAPKLAVAV